MSRTFLVFITLLLAISAEARANSKQQDAEELLHRASVSEIEAEDASAYALKMHFHILGLVSGTAQGTYEHIWASPERWRTEVHLPGIDEAVVRNASRQWV